MPALLELTRAQAKRCDSKRTPEQALDFHFHFLEDRLAESHGRTWAEVFGARSPRQRRRARDTPVAEPGAAALLDA